MHITAGTIVLIASLSGLLLFSHWVGADQSGPITGYAWSDTIGWIDLNCANTDTCPSMPFGFTSDGNGVVSGHAWSDNVGWISANASDLFGCPASPCSARISSNEFSGWVRALSGGTDQSGGWDGFISLSGPAYGITQSVEGSLSGFAWGSTVIGWVDFALSAGQCTPVYSCAGNARHNSCTGEDTPCLPTHVCSGGVCVPPNLPSGTITVSPSLVPPGATTRVIWSASDVSACTISEDSVAIDDDWTGPSGAEISSALSERTTYTLACTGTDGSTLTDSATVNMVPGFREI
jgi:hypothetical protein